MVIYFWHQLPWLGRLAGPVTQFLNMLECMSMPQAVILAALGFVGPLQWWTFQFVRLWRTSRVSPQLFAARFAYPPSSCADYSSQGRHVTALQCSCSSPVWQRAAMVTIHQHLTWLCPLNPIMMAGTSMFQGSCVSAVAGRRVGGGVGCQSGASWAEGLLVQVGHLHSHTLKVYS